MRINQTESQLAALAAEGILLEVRTLSDKGEKVLAQVDELLHGNAEMIAANPVRNVRELLDADEPPAKQPTRREAAVAFLSEEPGASEQAPAERTIRGENSEDEAEEEKAPGVESVSTSLSAFRPDQKPAPKKKRDQKTDRAERKQRSEKVEPAQEKRQARPAPKKEKVKPETNQQQVKPETKKEQVKPLQLPEVKPNEAKEDLSPSQYRQAGPPSAKAAYNQF